MSADNSQPNEPKSLETRLGLVMYGGVSLAIYINGVAQEFFNAVRGRGVYKLIKALTDSDIIVDIISGTSAGGINGIMLAYALCNGKEFTSSSRLWRNDGDIRRLLRSPHGRAESSWSLLNSEGFYQQQLEAAYRGMEKIKEEMQQEESPSEFRELDLFVTGTDVDGRRFTQFDDAGHPIDVKDHRSVFLLKHRKGRKEPFTPGGKGNTPPWYAPPGAEAKTIEAEDTFRALAKLSRLTSCFPAAFSPVTVTRPGPGGDGADTLLQWWGGLDRESVFLDGGLIDNKPFTHTLKEIFYRSAERRVNRRLFYVEPDPEHWEEVVSATQPNFAQAIIASLVGIPGYESISDDLRLLASHNSRLDRYNRLVESLHGQTEFEPPSEQDEMLYKRSRLIGLSERVMRGILRTGGRDELLDKDTRATAAELIKGFEQFFAEKVEDSSSVLSTQQTERRRALIADFWPKLALAQSKPEGDERSDETARVVAGFVAEWQKAEAEQRPKTLADEILADYDVEFRLRRLFHLVYFIVRQLADPTKLEKEQGPVVLMAENKAGHKVPSEVSRAAQYKKVWRLLNKQIELLDIILKSAEKVIDDSVFDWKNRGPEEIWRDARAALRYFLNDQTEAAKLLPAVLYGSTLGDEAEEHSSDFKTIFNKEVIELRDRVAEATAKELPGFVHEMDSKGVPRLVFKGKFKSILPIIDEAEAEMLKRLLPSSDDPVRKVYEGFPALDAKLYPIDLIAELHEKDIIKTVRVSPFDARRGFSNKGLSDKVSGDALYHFGGFFKRSWRSNDILWGRLDGLCQLVETLLSRDRLAEVLADERLRDRIREAFYEPDESGQTYVLREELSPKTLFGYGGELMWKKWEDWLRAFILGNDITVDRSGSTPIARSLVRAAAIEEGTLNEVIELLVEAAQLEIIKDDVPEVINDALQEQIVWNQFRIPRNGDGKPAPAPRPNGASAPSAAGNGDAPPAGAQAAGDTEAAAADALRDPFVFSPPPADLDAFVGVFAADEGRVRKWIDSMQPNAGDNGKRPLETRLGKFFREKYTVGAEALLKDIPLLVLLEILSVSLLVLRNCVLDIFGDRGERVKNHPLYLVAVDYPLRAFYLLVRFLRRAPRWEKQVWVVLALLSIISLTLSLLRWSAMIMPEGRFDILSFGIFIFMPVLVLYVLVLYIRREQYLRHRDKPGKSLKTSLMQKALRAVPLLVVATLAAFPLAVVGYVLANVRAVKGGEGSDLFIYLDTIQVGEGSWVYFKPGLIHPYLLVAACLLALAGPFLARAVAVKLIDFVDFVRGGRRSLKLRASALHDSLENYFSVPEMREIGRSLLVSTPLEWKVVRDHLDAKKRSETDPLKQRVDVWMKRLEELEKRRDALPDERKAAQQHAIDESAARLKPLSDALDALTKDWDKRLGTLDRTFASYKMIKWGNLRGFMERQGSLEDLPRAERAAWLEDLTYLTAKLDIPFESNGQEWPFIEEVPPGAPTAAAWWGALPFQDTNQPPRTEAERRERLARKIIDFANDRDSLARLAGRMRFINPEALYGE